MSLERAELFVRFHTLQYLADNQIAESRIAASHDLLQ
jgi:hypothetical protein